MISSLDLNQIRREEKSLCLVAPFFACSGSLAVSVCVFMSVHFRARLCVCEQSSSELGDDRGQTMEAAPALSAAEHCVV